jgi:hypothetical protein
MRREAHNRASLEEDELMKESRVSARQGEGSGSRERRERLLRIYS